MKGVDLGILVAYLALVLGLGIFSAWRRKPGQEFFLAGRSMTWLPVGLSVMTAVFSALNFTQFPTEVSGHGLYVLMVLPAFILVAIPVWRFVIPFYHSRQPVSAYEFLEQRFDIRVRRLASALFILWRLAWMSIVLHATCKPLNLITGLSMPVLILAAGAVTIVYSAAGGMRSIIWTDVAQFVVLIGGLLAGLIMAGAGPGGFTGILTQAAHDGLTRPFHPFDPQILSPDPRLRMTLWSCLIGGSVAFLTRYGADQMVVQRYFSARSLRDARLGFALNIACTLGALICLALLGFAVHAHAVHTGVWQDPGVKPVQHLVHFILALPRGIAGLLVAGLLASGMMDSGIHACATALARDFPGRLTRQARAGTVVIGLLVMALAGLVVGHMGSIFEVANRIVNGLGSPLLAVVLCGWIHRGFTARGVLLGGVAGAILSAAISFGVDNLALHYYAVANFLGTLALCSLCSLPGRNRNMANAGS